MDLLDTLGITSDMRSKALNYLMFLKHNKRTGTVKGHIYAHRRKKKAFVSMKEDGVAPTVVLSALVISCIQDTTEGRHVATCDIPGAFLQTD